MNSKGFTLIEFLIVISITLILAASSLPIYGSLQISSQLNENTSQITQALRIARNNSLNRVNASSYGVKFETDSYTLYQGNSYATRDTDYDRYVQLADVLSLSTNLAADEVVFSSGLGMPSTTGTVTLTHSVDGQSLITLNDLGIAEEE